MNKSILNPYDLPADGLATLRLMRKMFEQLSVSKENPNGFLGPNDRALFMFLAGVSPSFVGNVTGYSGNGSPVIHAPWMSPKDWAIIKAVLLVPGPSRLTSHPILLGWVPEILSVEFTYYSIEWVCNSAGRDLGEFFFARGWGVCRPQKSTEEMLFEKLNMAGTQLSNEDLVGAKLRLGRS